MKLSNWLFRSLVLLMTLAALSLAVSAKPLSAAATVKIQISFPDSPNVICGVGEISKIKTFPNEHRDYVRNLFSAVYPEIVKVYGEPLTESDDVLKVKVFYVPSASASMYLSHKSDTEIRVLASIIAGPIGISCAAFADIPDHAIFLHSLPGEGDFDHLFTHELTHAFHDRMDFLSWYTRSWLEEGMTEAATEIVADLMKIHYLRDIRSSGLNGGPADNLKHYDMWNHPFNGPGTSGKLIYTNSHALGAMHYFYGGVTLFPFGDDISFGLNRAVIPTDIRYGAATALWLILTKACSPNPHNPDFLRRLNHQLDVRGITSLRNNAQLFDEIDKVVGEATVDGQPVRQWLEGQALLKGVYKDDGQGALFIHVENPENFQEDKDQAVNITVYALYPISLADPGDILGNVNGAELPMSGCGIKIKIIDAAGKVWLERELSETQKGVYTFSNVITDVAGQNIPLPEGGYVIQATAGLCNRLSIGTGEWVKPGGITSATYAMRSGRGIGGEDSRLLGVTLNQPGQFGDATSLHTVGAATKTSIIQPYYTELPVINGSGSFSIENHGQNRPFEVTLAQWLPDGSQNRRPITVPFPYARVNWVETTPNFFVDVEPKESILNFVRSTDAAVKIIPNGIQRGLALGASCPIRLRLEDVPAGVKIDFDDPNATYNPGLQAPDPTFVKMNVQLTPEAKYGNYFIKVIAWGAGGGNCDGQIRYTTYQLRILKPVHLSVTASLVNSSGTAATASAPVTVTSDVLTGKSPTPINIQPTQFSEFTLEAQQEIPINGEKFQFANWEFNNDPNQHDPSNPLKKKIDYDLTLTARYVKKETVSVTVQALTRNATTDQLIAVPVSYSWGTSGSPAIPTPGGSPTDPRPTSSESGRKTTTFEVTPPRNVNVTLEAPIYVKLNDRFYQFSSWAFGAQTSTQPKLAYNSASSNATLSVYYRLIPPTYYELVAKHSGKCLDVEGGTSATANGAKAQQWTCSGTANQQWQFIPTGGGYYQILARHSGKALDVMGGVGPSGNGLKVQQWDYLGGANQQWLVTATGDGSYKITSRHSGKALDIEGGPGAIGDRAKAQQWDYLGGNNQKWVIRLVAPFPAN